MKNLKSLKLSGPLITDQVLASISASSLTTLHVQDCPVTDAGLSVLKNFELLYQLSLVRTQVHGTGLVSLKNLNTNMIDLTESPVTVAGIEVLSELPSLEWIILDRTMVDDSSVPALCQIPATKVSLLATAISQQGAQRYWAMKPAFTTVTLTTDGFHGSILDNQKKTNRISLRDEMLARLITQGGEVDVIESNQPNVVKRLQADDTLNDQPLVRFKIKRISLRKCVHSDDDLAKFAGVVCGYQTQPEFVDLEKVPIQGNGFRAWHQGINELRLNQTKLDDVGLKWLSRIRINKLQLDGTRITDAGTAWLRAHMHALTLNDTATGDLALENLARHRGAANLHELEMDGTKVTDAGLKHLEQFPHLKRLSLKRTIVTPAGIEFVKSRRPGITITQ
ncbi:MAG: hypothetical protein ACKVT0_23885 [Planctomycetaceae bacterium]